MHSNPEIYNELKELNSLLAEISNRNLYSVPEGYFNVLSEDVLLAVNENSPIEMQGSEVPAGYFDGLADSIMSRINASSDDDISPLLANLKGIRVFDTPEGYFESVPEAIMGKIRINEAEDEVSPLLDGLKNIRVYEVPAGYFNELPGTILKKISGPAKVVTMQKRPSFFRYAAAAAITGILGISLFSVFDNKKTADPEPISVASKVNLDEGLSNVSDNDIVNYLKESGMDVDAALVASVSDEGNLPDQVDYFTDDKTLDNLLNELKPEQSTNN